MIFQSYTIYFKAIGKDCFKVNNVVNFGGKYIYKDDKKTSKYNTLCEKMVGALIKNVFATLTAITISYCTFGASPLYVIIFEGAHVTFLSTELPFVDINTNIGYAINMIEQFILTFGAVVSNTTIEIGACLVNNTVTAVPELFHFESDELETELRSNGMSLNAKLRVRNMLVLIQDFNQ